MPWLTHLLRRDLHGQITTCHHDAIRLAQDVVIVLEAMCTLNLADDADCFTSCFIEGLPDEPTRSSCREQRLFAASFA
jgi:hypothetical protein